MIKRLTTRIPLMIFAIIFFASLVAAQAMAADKKKSDKLVKFINDFHIAFVRQGRDESQPVVEALSSGSEVEIVESNVKYSKVKTASGNVGWILNQELRDDPVAAHKLLLAQKQIALLESKIDQKDNELAEVNKGHNDLRKRFESMEVKLHRMEAENRSVKDMASDPLKLANLNKSLAAEKSQLEQELKGLKEQIDTLKEGTENRWFLTGAGVVFMSLLVGLMMPKFKSRKSGGWA